MISSLLMVTTPLYSWQPVLSSTVCHAGQLQLSCRSFSHPSSSPDLPLLNTVCVLCAFMLEEPALDPCVAVLGVWTVRGTRDLSGVITQGVATKLRI